MRYLVILIIALLPCLASADDASRKAAAGKLIEVVKTRETMRNAFIGSVDAIVTQAPGGKVATDELVELKKATNDWFDQELNWTELNSQLEDAFAQSFTEEELNQLVAFYQTPLGQKTLTQMPLLMRQALVIGQKFALSKQVLWTERLKRVDEKFRQPAAAPAPAAVTSGVLMLPAK